MHEKRAEIICPKCGKAMRFTKKITPPVEGIGGLIYRCPTRENEGGCGNLKEVLIKISVQGQEVFI